jgi:transposase
LNERIGVSDEEWSILGPLLPAERGRWGRPSGDNRPYFEGMLWMARTGAQWRHLPSEYGKWNSVFRRYRRWVETGVFDAMLQTLAELVARDRRADMVDSTIVRAHHSAVGIKRGLKTPKRLGARAVVSRRKSMPAATPKAARSASRSRPDRRTTAKAS